MARVEATVTRWVDDAFPGWVEVELAEADGTVTTLVDKAPVVTDRHLTAETAYPLAVALDCAVVGRERDETGEDDEAVVVVVLRHGIADRHGRSEFRVRANQLHRVP